LSEKCSTVAHAYVQTNCSYYLEITIPPFTTFVLQALPGAY